jgi:hypothetical protein
LTRAIQTARHLCSCSTPAVSPTRKRMFDANLRACRLPGSWRPVYRSCSTAIKLMAADRQGTPQNRRSGWASSFCFSHRPHAGRWSNRPVLRSAIAPARSDCRPPFSPLAWAHSSPL